MADVVLRYAQLGVEVTPGTAVAATRKIPSIVKPEPILNYYEPEVQRGDYVANYVVAPQGKLVNMTMDTQLYLGDLPLYLLSLADGSVTSTLYDTNGRQWSFTGTGTGALKSETMEWYDGAQGWQANYLRWKNMKISGEADKEVKVNLTGFGRAWTTNAPASLTQPVQVPVQSWGKILSVDAAGVAPGTTPITTTIVKFDWELDNQSTPIWAGNNSQNYQAISRKKFQPKLTIGCLFDGSFQWTNFDTGVRRVFQVEVRSTDLLTAAYQTIKLIMCGRSRAFKLDEYEGASYVEIDVIPEYDATLGYDWKVYCANTVTSY